MFRIGLRDAKSHFSRFIMSIIAIALGVAFIIGSFCFSDMLSDQMTQAYATSSDGDVYVRGAHKQNLSGSSKSSSSSSSSASSLASSVASYNSISANLISEIKDVKGVDTAFSMSTLSTAVLVGKDGAAVSSATSSITAVSMAKGQTWRTVKMVKGHYPHGSDEIVLLNTTAKTAGLKLGNTTKVVLATGIQKVKVVGIFTMSSVSSGSMYMGLDPEYVDKINALSGADSSLVSSITVYGTANHGKALTHTQQVTLAKRINNMLDSSKNSTGNTKAHAVTGTKIRAEQTKTIRTMMGFIQPLILIFAVIALFVGSFIIANTFSMIVRESMRGYALLRSIGASPMQVFSTVIIQSIVLGIVGSIIGIFLGWGLIALIALGLSATGAALTGSTVPSVSSILVGLLVGVAVSIAGALLPARQAAYAPPIQAMNETVSPQKSTRGRGWLGLFMCVAGAAVWWLTVANKLWDSKEVGPTPFEFLNNLSSGWTLAIGTALVVLGIIVVTPSLVVPMEHILGWIPSLVFPVTGRLASRNLARSKRRTSNTAAALFVGVAIVSCIGTLTVSIHDSVAGIIDSGLQADFVVMSATSTLPDGVEKTIKDVQGVKSVSTQKLAVGIKYNNKSVAISAVVPRRILQDGYTIHSTSGNAQEALKNGQLIVGKTIADEYDWTVGQTLTMKQSQAVLSAMSAQTGSASSASSPSTASTSSTDTKQKSIKVKIGAITDSVSYSYGIFMTKSVITQLIDMNQTYEMQMFVTTKSGTNLSTMQKRITRAVKKYYVVSVLNKDEYVSSISAMINTIVYILYALLVLSLLISIFGIVNTMMLSVSERTREIGLLRAIGTSRGQVRGMIAIEAVMISILGTVLGIGVGVSAAAVIQKVFESRGVTVLSIPWNQLGMFLILAVIVGLLASIMPASAALRVPVLDAVTDE